MTCYHSYCIDIYPTTHLNILHLCQVGMLNAFRMHRQAQGIQTLARLQDSVGVISLKPNDEKERVYQELVNFHGEMLLLMHWSILAYTAIVKLLKKHHKRTGSLVQAPHLRDLLSQPSWSTEVITGIISQTEMCIGRMQAHLQSIRASSDRQTSLGQVESTLAPQAQAQANQAPQGMDIAPNAEGKPVGGSPGHYQRHSSSSLSLENEVVMQTIVSITSGEDSHDSGVEDQDEDMPQAPTDEVASAPPAPVPAHPHPQNQGSGDNSAAAANPHQPETGAAGGHGSVSSVGPDPPSAQRAHSSPSGIEHLVNIPLLQQMHVALRTWDYLYDHASTPSTVLGVGAAGRTPAQTPPPTGPPPGPSPFNRPSAP